jgi:glutathionyl-hydroquinone reductase
MKVRRITKRPPPVHPIASRIVVIRSLKQLERFFGTSLADKKRAAKFFNV